MTDLLDIAPATAVEIVRLTGERRVKVAGLHGNAIAAIAARFPELVTLLAVSSDSMVPRLVGQFGAAIAPIIAAGCGHLGDEKAEQIAGALLVEDQARLLKAIVGLTLPNGMGSLMETMAGFMTGAEKEKRVRVRLKKSPSASPPSSEKDSHPTMQ